MSKLNIKVTNPMVRALKKIMPNYKIALVKLTKEQYSCLVDYDVYRNEVDYDWKTCMFKAIQIIYPPEDYACDKYLTTRDLSYCLKQSDKTLKGFLNEVSAFCGI